MQGLSKLFWLERCCLVMGACDMFKKWCVLLGKCTYSNSHSWDLVLYGGGLLVLDLLAEYYKLPLHLTNGFAECYKLPFSHLPTLVD